MLTTAGDSVARVLIPAKFNGPPRSGNGGFTAGTLASYVDAEVIIVRLRLPPPLDVELTVDAGGTVRRAFHGDRLVAEASPAVFSAPPVPSVSPAAAASASEDYWGYADHPFPTCFVCGPEHPDGLHLYTGPTVDGRVAAPWTPDGTPPPEIVWAVLDCPGGWAARIDEQPAVLGTMTATVRELPAANEPCVVVAESRGYRGRKAYAASALYGQDGRLLGRAEQIWIAVDPATFGPRTTISSAPYRTYGGGFPSQR
jgi:hypothetical protein